VDFSPLEIGAEVGIGQLRAALQSVVVRRRADGHRHFSITTKGKQGLCLRGFAVFRFVILRQCLQLTAATWSASWCARIAVLYGGRDLQKRWSVELG